MPVRRRVRDQIRVVPVELMRHGGGGARTGAAPAALRHAETNDAIPTGVATSATSSPMIHVSNMVHLQSRQ